MRAQATLFIIVGMMLILVVSMVYVVSTETSRDVANPARTVDEFAQPVYSYIDQCMEISAAFAVDTIASQGGYYNVPPKATSLAIYDIPYYFDQQDGAMVPSKETVEEQLAIALREALESCTGDFTVFNGYSINENGLETYATIAVDNVYFKAEYDLDISKDNKHTKLGTFQQTRKSSLGKHLEIAGMVIEEQEKAPNNVQLTRLMDIGYDYKIVFNSIYDEDTVIYIITENVTEPQAFTFAVLYDWPEFEQSNSANDDILLEGYVGYPIEYKFEEEGDYSSVGLAKITSKGVISYTPTDYDIGAHSMTVKRENNGIIEYYNIIMNITSDNSAPDIDEIPLQTIDTSISSVYEYQVTATDPDGDQILYNLITPFDNMMIDTIKGKITFDAANAEKTIYTITVVATDPTGRSNKESFNLVIK